MAWLILADDLTGACDCGAAFARVGYETRVLLALPRAPLPIGIDRVYVYSTNSRALPAVVAAQILEAGLRELSRRFSPQLYYQKIDSTLRGNPASDLKTALRALALERAIFCPAFPDQGRIVKGGRVWVHGQRLEETAFAHQATSGDVRKLLSTDFEAHFPSLECLSGEAAPFAGAGIYAPDAESEEDLRAIARAGMRAVIRMWCGSAGLARALAEELPPREPAPRSAWQSNAPWLIVAGSRSPVTARQVERLVGSGAAVFRLAVRAPQPGLAGTITACLAQKRSAVLVPSELPYYPGEEAAVAGALAEMVRQVIAHSALAGVSLLLTGGDTALAVCQALGCSAIRLTGEIEPGIALGVLEGGISPGRQVVTKAGGFGDDETLAKLIK